MQAIHAHHVTAETREVIYNLLAAYLHTVPLAELLESVNEPGETRSSGMWLFTRRPAAIASLELSDLKGHICERLHSAEEQLAQTVDVTP